MQFRREAASIKYSHEPVDFVYLHSLVLEIVGFRDADGVAWLSNYRGICGHVPVVDGINVWVHRWVPMMFWPDDIELLQSC